MNPTIPVSGHLFAVESEGNRIGIPHLFIETPNICRIKDYCYICSNSKKLAGEVFDRNFSEDYDYEGLTKLAAKYSTKNIVFDCGEYAIIDGFKPVFEALYENGYYLTLTTSLKISDELIKYVTSFPNLLIHAVASRDLDLSKLHMLRPTDQIKVVVNTYSHFEFLHKVVAENPEATVFAVPVPKKLAMGNIPDDELISELEVFDTVCDEGLNCKVIIPQHMYIEGLF